VYPVELVQPIFRLCGHLTDSFEDTVAETMMIGGDTDTNGAIEGPLAGAVYGAKSVARWAETLMACDASNGRPRPERYQSSNAYHQLHLMNI
jgi:ADP-ribosylglycohydrolase